ncbi:MAG: peptidylprolyl isomerase [bacterium]|nr:peptidylprolyl isomerase [bacterium]
MTGIPGPERPIRIPATPSARRRARRSRPAAARTRLAAVMLAALLAAGCGWLGKNRAPAEDPGDIALFVNGDPIHYGEVAAMKKAIIAHAPADYPRQSIALMEPRIEQEARENLIREKLLDQAVELEHINPTAAQVGEAMRTLGDYLQAHGSSIEAFVERRGSTPEAIRQEVRRRLSRDLLVDKRLGYRPAPETEARAYFEKNRTRYNWPESVRFRQILVSFPDGYTPGGGADDPVMLKANAIRERLLAGIDFAAVAHESSDDPSAAKGGEMGWIVQGSRLPPEVIEAAFNQPIGEIGPVFSSMLGYHIIQVTGRREAHEAAFAEVREIVEHDLHQEWRARNMPDLVRQLREEARIVEPSALGAPPDAPKNAPAKATR